MAGYVLSILKVLSLKNSYEGNNYSTRVIMKNN